MNAAPSRDTAPPTELPSLPQIVRKEFEAEPGAFGRYLDRPTKHLSQPLIEVGARGGSVILVEGVRPPWRRGGAEPEHRRGQPVGEGCRRHQQYAGGKACDLGPERRGGLVQRGPQRLVGPVERGRGPDS